MQPQMIYPRDVLSASTNDLNQEDCTLEMVLDNIFGFDAADLASSEAELEHARQMVESYPALREVLTLVWESLVGVQDKIADTCMTVESGRPKAVALSDAL